MKMMTASAALVCAMMALAGVAALPVATPEDGQPVKRHLVNCPLGWYEIRGRCFSYVPKAMTWARAEKNCESLGGNLASIHSIREYQDIQALVRRLTYQLKVAWIGGSDAQEESQWFWIDGTPFHYSNWCPGEPNNSIHNQHCSQMNYADQACWDDDKCWSRKSSLCVRKIQ